MFLPGAFFSFRFQLIIVGLRLVHLLIDFVKFRPAGAHLTGEGDLPFVIDQVAHAATVFVAAGLLVPSVPFADLLKPLGALRGAGNRILFVALVYVTVIFAGG